MFISFFRRKQLLFFKDLVDRIEQENLAAARGTIKRTSMMLLTASKAYLRHPELPYARENRDFIFNQVRDAVGTISSITQGRPVQPAHTLRLDSSLSTVGDLTRALNEFDVKLSLLFRQKQK